MTQIVKLGSLFDEKTWSLDSGIKGSGLYKVNSTFVSLGKVDSAWDKDYFNIDGFLAAGSTYEIHLTSDEANHGWSSNSESKFLEFDLYDYDDNLIGSSTVDNSRTLFDDVLEFTVPSDYQSLKPYYIDIHGFVSSAADYAVTLNPVIATPIVNNAPTITTSTSLTTEEDTSISRITYNGSDIDGDTLTFSFSDPSKGSVANNQDGTYSYTPNANENGSDSFTVTVNDGTVGVSQTVNVTINSVNDAPEGSITVSGNAVEGQTLTADTSTLSDADGLGTLSYQWKADGIDINESTSATLVLEKQQVGKEISVNVAYTDQDGTQEVVESASTNRVAFDETNVAQTFVITVAPATSGYGNRYVIDGVEAPALQLEPGKTYAFDLSDASTLNHPLDFNLDSADWTLDVTTFGDRGTDQKIYVSIPQEVSGDITYYCTKHSGMGNAVAVELPDTIPPTVSIAMSDQDIKAGDTSTVTFSFSEAPTGFTAEDVIVANGALSDFTVTSDAKVYTATYTPTADVEDATNVISVGTDWTDAAENAPAATTDSSNYAVDTRNPNLTVTSADTTSGLSGTSEAGAAISVTITDPSGTSRTLNATADDTNTGAWNISSADILGSEVTSEDNGTYAFSVTASDAAGNSSEAATASLVVDEAAPNQAPVFKYQIDAYSFNVVYAGNDDVSIVFDASDTLSLFGADDATFEFSYVDVADISDTSIVINFDGIDPNSITYNGAIFNINQIEQAYASSFLTDSLTLNGLALGFNDMVTTSLPDRITISLDENSPIIETQEDFDNWLALVISADEVRTQTFQPDTDYLISDVPNFSKVYPVTISGELTAGADLNVSIAAWIDPDGTDNTTFEYQWLRDGADISGATSSTYTLAQADVGAAVAARVGYT
ncbi:Ig-like domain-containing protein, partial [Rhodobacteraceae bacterium]|nr:Ig-like domain-containing protein [Paracoccaceae bacterium]